MSDRKRILVADDSAEDFALLKRAFQECAVDLDLFSVRDGEETINYLSGDDQFRDRAAHPLPQFILLDLKMPRMDGFDVLVWLHKQPRLKRLPVLVLSSSDQEMDVNRAYELGANSYIVKPYSLEGYVSMVEKLHAFWMEVSRCPNC
ncbi:MAG TPA: response regulator [Candidatus Angelobacter sp.]|nr:response regulator [Candidatus Angelobacter sp.]